MISDSSPINNWNSSVNVTNLSPLRSASGLSGRYQNVSFSSNFQREYKGSGIFNLKFKLLMKILSISPARRTLGLRFPPLRPPQDDHSKGSGQDV
jgi:hypothetical protein